MLTRIKNQLLVGALAFFGMLTAGTVALAQPCTCNVVDGCKVITYYDDDGNITGTETICPSTGSGTFNCNFVEIPPTGPLNLSIPPDKIDVESLSPLYGPIVTSIDQKRTSSNATIVSNNARERFPLTVRFSFYARTNVAGREYCSTEELIFENTSVYSFNPFNKEKFCLVNDVKFVPCDDPTAPVAFVLAGGSTCVTLN